MLLGVTIDKCSSDKAEGRMSAGAGHTTGGGARVHGGILMAFADCLASAAVARQLGNEQWTTTVDSHTHFVRRAVPGQLTGVATALSRSKSSQLWQTQVFDVSGELVAVVMQTQLIVQRDISNATEPAIASTQRAPAATLAVTSSAKSGELTIPEQRRRQIFEAASAVFGRKGYGGAAVRDIAEEAGMPISTMYQYVPGKEDILRLVFETYMAEIAHALDAAAERSKPPRQRLADAVAANLRLYDAYRHQIRLMYQETRSLTGGNRESVLDLTRAANRVWEQIIEDGIAAGEFKCAFPAVTANLIPMLCASWVLRRWNMPEATLDDVLHSITEMLFNGVTVHSPAKA
jgi:uncharacterized protein (TIGR00369 family)